MNPAGTQPRDDPLKLLALLPVNPSKAIPDFVRWRVCYYCTLNLFIAAGRTSCSKPMNSLEVPVRIRTALASWIAISRPPSDALAG